MVAKALSKVVELGIERLVEVSGLTTFAVLPELVEDCTVARNGAACDARADVVEDIILSLVVPKKARGVTLIPVKNDLEVLGTGEILIVFKLVIRELGISNVVLTMTASAIVE